MMGVKRRATPAASDTKRETTIGLFGHSFYPDGHIHMQFEIVREVQHGFVVQRFSWLTGEPTDLGFMQPEDLAACKLYSDKDAWHAAGHAGFEAVQQGRKEGR
jgi:hypothetical protein